jgi:hypothetical protein
LFVPEDLEIQERTMTRVSAVDATAPNIMAMARPWKIGSKSMTKEPTTTAAAVSTMGLNRTAPP